MLIQTEGGRAEVVSKQLAALAGVLSSEYVTGPYDVVVRIGADNLADLQANVVASVQQVTGITRTLTSPIATECTPRVWAVDAETRDGPPRALLIAAIVVAVGAIIGILVFAALRAGPPEQRPVAIATVPAPKAESAECRALLDALPQQLGDYRRAAAADPAPAGAAAWKATAEGEPVILRCGLDRPAEFVVGSPIQVVDAVQWFGVGEAGAGSDPADKGASTWFA